MKNALIALLLLLSVAGYAQSPSLVTDSTGAITGIRVKMDTETYRGQTITRYAVMLKTEEYATLDMTMKVFMDWYDPSGRKLIEVIQSDTTMKPIAKLADMSRYATVGFDKTTIDSWVVVATGAKAVAGQAGAEPERRWLQRLTTAHLQAFGFPVTSTTPEQVKRYLMMEWIIKKRLLEEGLPVATN